MVDETILTPFWLEYRTGTPQTPMSVADGQLFTGRKLLFVEVWESTHFLSQKTDRTWVLFVSIGS